MRIRGLRSLVLLGLLLAPVLPGQAYDPARRKLQGTAVRKLHEVATWCTRRGLGREELRVHQLIVQIDADDAVSRKRLGFEKDGSGVWRQGRRPTWPEIGTEKLGELFTRRQEIVNVYRAGLLKLLQRNLRKLDPGRRHRELVSLLPLETGLDEIVSRLDQVKIKGKRTLPETAIANARRPVLRALGSSCLAVASEPKTIEPDATEKGVGLEWKGTVATRYIRVLSTESPEGAVEAARATEAVGELFRLVFETKTAHRKGLTAYLVSSEQEKAHFANHHPNVSQALRTQLGPNHGGWLDAYRVIHYGAGRGARVDAACRQVLSNYVADAWKTTPSQGWAYEGAGLWLTHTVTGTRMTWFTRPESGSTAKEIKERRRLCKPKTDWMKEAKKIMSGDSVLTISAVTSRNSADLKPKEVVHSYAFCSYLIEGFPVRAAKIFADAASGDRLSIVIEKNLGWSMDKLDRRFSKWVKERPKK
ncbi:MAG: hypothetical protein CMJ83_11785 [Planctomycetes bacterium]|nr:hypothetical protein [Planctomycetota bacterium]